MAKRIINYLPVIVLVFIAFLLALQNYTPGTFLSGWDTLHLEFNFGLNFQRLFFGVFRPEQGLGAVAAHSHMSDLPRVILLYIFDQFIPLSFLRYSYIFLNLILGPIGMYYFLQKVVLKDKIASFLGGLFYLLNLGTMQQFVVPFEMFTTQFALLPWLFFFATKYILENKKTNLLFFALTTLFATPIAFAATLWYFQFFIFGLYILTLTFSEVLRKNFQVVKKIFIILGLALLINSFWILPNLYFISNYAESVRNSSINQLFSDEAFLYNKEFGNIKDLSLLKSFLFDWSAYSGNNNF